LSRKQQYVFNVSTMLLLTYLITTALASDNKDSSSTHFNSGSNEHNARSEQGQGVVGDTSTVDRRAFLYYGGGADSDNFGPLDAYTYSSYLPISDDRTIMESLRPNKRGMDDAQMPGVLRFGKRAQSFIRFGRSGDMMDDGSRQLSKKEMPGVLRFGKRRVEGQQEKKAVPGVLRFGKRDDIPGVLRFGKRDADMPGVLRFGKRYDLADGNNYVPAGVLRFGKRNDMPGVLRFGKKSDMPGVLRFGKRSSDMPGVLRFGKRSTDMPGVLRFG